MSNERYPDELVLTEGDFEESAWRALLSEVPKEGYPSIHQVLSNAASVAVSEGNQSQGKILWLLADACSMMLSSKSFSEPFKPFLEMEGRRSAIPDDFTPADISFFETIVESIDHVWLRARIADLIWVMRKPREIKYALITIDAYKMIPLDKTNWIRGGRDCWERAISLARMVHEVAQESLLELEAKLQEVFDTVEKEDGFFGLWLANLLADSGLGRDKADIIAHKLEELSIEFDEEGNFDRSRQFWYGTRTWFKIVGDNAKYVQISVKIAETWVNEAVQRISSAQPSYLVAGDFYEKAIQVLRTIPQAQRGKWEVNERISVLIGRLNDAAEKSQSEMQIITFPNVDISEMVATARKEVQGKTAVEALRGFVRLSSGTDVDKMHAQASSQINEFPLHRMFPGSMMSKEGRVIAKHPGMSFNSSTSENDEVIIRAEMIRDFGVMMTLAVQGGLVPGLEALQLEHRFREADFIEIANRSPIVPEGRGRLFGKGLFAGYERDFVSSLHILVPQIEHMVRYHLKNAKVKTTTLDSEGIENEMGLSSLMKLQEVEDIFGRNLKFEIEALYCDSFGSNLRNEVAHGLADEGVCYSTSSAFAWWFTLRIVFNTFWNSHHKVNEDAETDSPSE